MHPLENRLPFRQQPWATLGSELRFSGYRFFDTRQACLLITPSCRDEVSSRDNEGGWRDFPLVSLNIGVLTPFFNNELS